MKTRLFTILILAFITGFSSLIAQGFEPPAEGKAVVYFVRVSIYGKPMKFEFFHQNRYFAELKGKQYLRYECDPGEQLFWASTENKEFMTAELAANETYIVIVDVITGFFKPHVGLSPITAEDTERFDRAKELVNKKEPEAFNEADIEKKNKKMEKFIAKELAHYEETKSGENFRHLSADMAISADALK